MATTISGTTITFNDGTTQTTTGIEFASGTVMMFRQTSAPTGWTKDTTNYNDHALRVVTGTIGSGGSVDFSTAMASRAVNGSIGNTTAGGSVSVSGGGVGATTLSTSQMPSHNHSATAYYYKADPPASNLSGFSLASNPWTVTTSSAGSGNSHTHTFTNPTASFTGSDHNHTFSGTAINMAVKYCDVIFATKN